jgi:hypothetical protein
MVFELPLTEEKVKPHQVTALHLLVGLAFTGAGALFYSFYPTAKTWSILLLAAGLLLLLVAMFRNRWVTASRRNRIFRIAELMVLLCLASFSAIHKWTPPAAMFGILSAAVLFAIFWERGSNSSMAVRIDKEGVKLPVTARKRFIPWQDIEQVLFKFGTLTINCCDNRLFQWTIGNLSIDKENFEAFCNKQIEAAKEKRLVNDW